jgi:chromosome partitioning protein
MGNQICLSVLGRKGGVGKTTTCVGLASVFASQKKRVLIVDLDPQSNAAYGLGVDPGAPGTVELFRGQNPDPIHAGEGIFVLPGNAELNEKAIQDAYPDELSQRLRGVNFDVILFDCPPGNDRLELQAVTASNAALVVVDAHKFALTGAARVIAFLEDHRERRRPGPDRWALVMSKSDLRRVADRNWTDEVRNAWKHLKCFELRQDAELARATNAGIPVMQACPETRAVEDLKTLTRWVRG